MTTEKRNYKEKVYLLNGKVIAEIVIPDHFKSMIGDKKSDWRIDGKDFDNRFFWQLKMSNKQLEKAFKSANEWINERMVIVNKNTK